MGCAPAPAPVQGQGPRQSAPSTPSSEAAGQPKRARGADGAGFHAACCKLLRRLAFPITTEEFYAQDLIAALPIALRGHQPEAKPKMAQEAHAYAGPSSAPILTDIFKLNHGTYHSQ